MLTSVHIRTMKITITSDKTINKIITVTFSRKKAIKIRYSRTHNNNIMKRLLLKQQK